ncbi:MAG: formylglycine-generating enzyme family protein, partial [Planctomycetota bacterium]
FEIAGGFRPDWPVLAISWEDASAYVAWLDRRAEEKGERWEYALPKEEEWERAAKGADGRSFPWGNGFDWTFCKGGSSRVAAAQPEPVALFPADESPFGVRDMGGEPGSCAGTCTRRGSRTGPLAGAVGASAFIGSSDRPTASGTSRGS